MSCPGLILTPTARRSPLIPHPHPLRSPSPLTLTAHPRPHYTSSPSPLPPPPPPRPQSHPHPHCHFEEAVGLMGHRAYICLHACMHACTYIHSLRKRWASWGTVPSRTSSFNASTWTTPAPSRAQVCTCPCACTCAHPITHVPRSHQAGGRLTCSLARSLTHRYREVIKQVVDRMSSLDGKTLALYRSMTQDYDDHVRHPASRPTVDVSS